MRLRDDPRAILRAARGLIERRWGKGDYQLPNGAVCAFGAINKVAEGDAREDAMSGAGATAARLLADAYADLHPSHLDLAEFNDEPSTKKADILAVYDAALAMLAPAS